MSDQTTPSQDRIESDLQATRTRLAAHLDELTSRLSPGQLLDEGLAYVRTGDGADFVNNLRVQVRENPVPAVLTGIGLAWLAMGGGTRRTAGVSRSRALVPYGEGSSRWADARDDMWDRAHRAGESISRNAGEAEDAFRARVHDAQAAVLGVTRQAQETASGFADRVREAMDRAREKAAEWRDQASTAAHQGGSAASGLLDRSREGASRAGDYASQAGSAASDASARLASALGENPLLMAAVGMTAGALFGALLPRTQAEHAYLGEAAGRAGHQVSDMVGDLAERGAEVVKAATNAATDAGMRAARDQGLTGTAGGNGGKPEQRPAS